MERDQHEVGNTVKTPRNVTFLRRHTKHTNGPGTDTMRTEERNGGTEKECVNRGLELAEAMENITN